jgi:predicted glycogen debranching enzyme
MDDAELHRPAWVARRPIGARTLIEHEWIVTNGLGGYASGTIGGVMTRKYHGYLVAALPAPLGRLVMLQNLRASLVLADGREVPLSGEERLPDRLDVPAERTLVDFRLELGLPVWEHEVDGVRLAKRVLMPHGQNTVHVAYRLLSGAAGCRLHLRPFVHFRSYEAPVTTPQLVPHCVVQEDNRVELRSRALLPPLRLTCRPPDARFTADAQSVSEVVYRLERDRGYEWRGVVWSPGFFELPLPGDVERTLVASTEPWEVVDAHPPHGALRVEQARRRELLRIAGPLGRDRVGARLTLAADAFIITPAGRVEDEARARAAGDEARTIIAGYHWFTDWGRDTMISLEGLTLCTGRHREAGYILRTFAHHVRDGLIPNMFPDGASEGLYHTADATLWFFHAVHRYVQTTGNRATLRAILPRLRDIVDRHIAGTRFGIGADPGDSLLVQGADTYQLTWMDAKVDGWVVTPRRGKAVEINALWYNALRLLAAWNHEDGDESEARRLLNYAAQVCRSFNRRFWYAEGGYLYDVVDDPSGGDDAALRPNQLLAISLEHPVLDRERWPDVLGVVRRTLLTPVGLRSLSPSHPDYKPGYAGDLRTRDGAYHQGTVWAWLIGPFVDAWLRVYPDDATGARECLHGLVTHLDDYGVGTLAEIFDAEPPYTPRGCIAQAWSVAELLRAWARTAPIGPTPHPRRENAAGLEAPPRLPPPDEPAD